MSRNPATAGLRLSPLMMMLVTSAALAEPSVPVKVINGLTNPVPVTGAVGIAGTPTVNVGTLPAVTGTVGISGTPNVNVLSMPPVSVTTAHDSAYFVVPYALTVTGTDHIGVSLTRPAILDSISTACNGSLRGLHFQVTIDSRTTSATAFDAPPAGTQLLARSSLTGIYNPITPSLNYPSSDYQTLLDYPSIASDSFNVTQLNQVVLSDVDVLGPAFSPFVTFCHGFFLFRKL